MAAEVIAAEIEATEVAEAGVEVTVGVTMEAVVHLLRITEADPEGIIVQDLDHTLLVSEISNFVLNICDLGGGWDFCILFSKQDCNSKWNSRFMGT